MLIADSDDDDRRQSVYSDSDPETDCTHDLKASGELHETKGPEVPSLSNSVLQMLGKDKRLHKEKTYSIHPELSDCWKAIISSGLDKNDKTTIIDKYPNKGNCTLSSPVLNPELLPLLHKTAKSRDKYLSNNQDLIGRGLVSLGQAICNIFNDEVEPVDKTQLLQLLCDSSALFCESFHQLCKSRRSQIYPCVDDKRKSVLEDSITDDFLFGQDLGKRIKNSVAVEKTGLSIKPQPPKKDFPTTRTSLNWKGPSGPRANFNQTGYQRPPFAKPTYPNKQNNQIATRSRARNQTNQAQHPPASTQK
ncbi:uncharacterized protein LOC123261824 [Cotesia glomerata]|uniref:uncharacterized protein LOC123261824 n=1 Tax=Cotesia glomerata TaxID=32391 RepID=UPI001D00380B|nr:uncharacterized protein LOC123261824 [Cotesia glomerata]